MQMTLPFLAAVLLTFSSCLSVPQDFQRAPRQASSNSPMTEESSAPLEIYVPYVGQGDATLIRSPSGKTLLIDAGPPSSGKGFLLPLLRRLGITRLNALLITHYDLDHLGGVPELLAGEDGILGNSDDIAIDGAWDRGGIPYGSSPGLTPYRQALHRTQTPLRMAVPGEEIILDPELRIRVIATNGQVLNSAGNIASVDLTPETFIEQENAASIALLVEYGSFRYLSSGDLTGGGMLNGFLTPDVETRLGEAVGRVDALHANHHGSLSSSNPDFVEATAPEAVFIQAGVENPYGHPALEVTERWADIGARIYSTKEGKGYLLISEGGSFQVEDIDL